jgi:hypothetical protein
MTVSTDQLRTNRDRLPTVRAIAYVTSPGISHPLLDPTGTSRPRPGQNGVALNVAPGDLAAAWLSDHLEPGASLAHPEPSANLAFQTFCCVGNRALVTSGAAAGRRGVIIGKHGTTLAAFDAPTLSLLAPGDAVCVDTQGVGLAIEDMPDVCLHSISPDVLEVLARRRGDKLTVHAVTTLPPAVAAAGIGMEASWANQDLETHHRPGGEEVMSRLRFGDLVLLAGQDHRYGRQYDPGWTTLGVIAHGASVSGGHGLGMTTLLTAPSHRLVIEHHAGANLTVLIPALGSAP